MDRQVRKVAEVKDEGLYGEENYPEACNDSEEEAEGNGNTAGQEKEDKSPGVGVASTKPVPPPRGLKMSRKDLTAFATGDSGRARQ